MKSLVITSVADDKNKIFREYSKILPENFKFIVIGDKKSPKTFNLKKCVFYGVEEQKYLKYNILKKLPYNHYSRKNIGYLISMEKNCEEIYETDDDNMPYNNFFMQRNFNNNTKVLDNGGIINIYSFFTKKNIWARGFPIEFIQDQKFKDFKNIKTKKIFTPIFQGLADENPDVDAIYRLTKKLPIYFDKNKNITLLNTYSPFNSQNTIWNKKAFPLLYIPSFCSFRLCDIWRSFVALRICFEYSWGINFFSPSVFQKRNEHNLLKDFEDEIEGYKNNLKIINGLKNLKLHEEKNKIFENLTICYKFLIKESYVDKKELNLLELWIKDCKNMIKEPLNEESLLGYTT